MSRIVSIHTQFRDVEILTACLEFSGCQVLREPNGIMMPGASAPVDVLVHANFGALGFRKRADGQYEVIGEDQMLARHQDFLNRLAQQYAYRKIIKDARAAGYNVVQEEMGEDCTIKLVVRKWS